MNHRWTTRLTFFTIAAAVLFTGCATIRDSQARETEQWLAAAGFTMHPADAQQLSATPPNRLVSREENGTVEYVYADPTRCQCLYVGGPKEYSEYQRLEGERQLEMERLWSVEDTWPRWNYTGDYARTQWP